MSQINIRIQLCYIMEQYSDTAMLCHRAISRYSSVTSWSNIRIQLCYVTEQYPDTALLCHRAVPRYSSVMSQSNIPIQYLYITESITRCNSDSSLTSCTSTYRLFFKWEQILLSQAMKHELCSFSFVPSPLTPLPSSGRLRRAPNLLHVIQKYTKKLPSFAEVVFSLRRSNGCRV